MMGNTTDADILKAVLECLSRLGLDLARLSALATDGAPSMVGGNKGFSSLMVKHCQDRGFKQPIKKLHCIVHQEAALCAKSAKMRSVMSVAVKVVNFVLARGFNHRQFRDLLMEADAQYGDLLYYCEVRWLSRGRMLERLYNLRKEVSAFLCSKGADFPEFNDPGWLCDLNVQGKDILMPDMVSRITAFEVKLRLWESQLMKSNFTHFKRLHACSPEDVSVHVGIVTQLREEFSARFSDLRGYKDDFKLFTSLFDVDVESAPSEVQMELVDLQCSDELKSRFAAVGHADFWRKHILPTKRFPGLVDNAMRTVAAFGCT